MGRNWISKFYCLLFGVLTIQLASAETVQERFEMAEEKQLADPRGAIRLLEKNENAFFNDERESASVPFKHFFLLFQLYIKIDQYDQAQAIYEKLNTKTDFHNTHAAWLALMGTQIELHQNKTMASDELMTPYLNDYTCLEDQALSMWYYYVLGSLQARSNEYAGAFSSLSKADELATQLNNKNVKIQIQDQLVILYYEQHRYDKGLDASQVMMDLVEEVGDEYGRLRALVNLMNMNYLLAVEVAESNPAMNHEKDPEYLKHFNASVTYKEQVLKMVDRLDSINAKIRALIFLQNQQLAQDDIDGTIKYAKQTIELAEQNGRIYERAISLNNLAIGLMFKGEYEESRKILKEAEEYYKQTDNKRSLLWIPEDLSKSYELEGDYKTALDYYKKYNTNAHLFYQNANREKVIELQTKFETQKKNQEIENLNHQAALDAKQLEKERMGRWLLIVCLVAVFLISMTLFVKRNKLNALLRKQRALTEEVAEMGKAKQRFFVNISHEFRTALTLSVGALRELSQVLNTEHDQSRSTFEVALNNNLHMISLLNEVMMMERLENNQMPVNVMKIEPVKIIESVMERFESLLSNKNISLNCAIEDVDGEIYFDPSHFEKSFCNLLSNAVKFSPKNSEIKIELINQSNRLIVNVIDNGPGIADSEKGLVFKRFFQGSESMNKAQPGAGIGLSMVKELMMLHHGEVNLINNEAAGCTGTLTIMKGKSHYDKDSIVIREVDNSNEQSDSINVELDRIMRTGASQLNHFGNDKNPADKEELVDSLNQAIIAKPMIAESNDLIESGSGQSQTGRANIDSKDKAHDNEQRPVIMLVDDNIGIRHLLRSALQQDYHIVEAENGKEALVLARSLQPDLIISDILMPELNGLELTQKLRECPELAHLSIILLTALGELNDTVKGLNSGADDYIVKPFDSEELVARVRSHLTQKKRLSNSLYKSFVKSHQSQPSIRVVEQQSVKRCKKLEAIISENLGQCEFDVEQMYQSMNMTRSTLFRYTNKVYGCSPKNLLKKRRLEASYEMLQERQGSVSEIAYAVGFQSLSSFSRAFREHYQQAPTQISVPEKMAIAQSS
ncbi:MAG: response regulator [Gammaproteobacteria bacterium]|nr:response regulator [Gammaproteobacteria bacterium]